MKNYSKVGEENYSLGKNKLFLSSLWKKMKEKINFFIDSKDYINQTTSNDMNLNVRIMNR